MVAILRWSLILSYITVCRCFRPRTSPIHRTHLLSVRDSICDSPKNRYSVKYPLNCKIHSVQKIGSNNFDRDFYHIELDHGGEYVYTEGQYCGIIPPGISRKTNRRHPPRSYSLTPAFHDNKNRLAICIRVTRPDHETLGLCSRFLASCEPGTSVDVTGPFGKDLTLSEEEAAGSNLVLIATGTGISPFRGFLKRIRDCGGDREGRRILLFFGIQNYGTFLYREELEKYRAHFGEALTIIPCFSRQDGLEKRYVQEGIRENRGVLCDLAQSPRRCSVFVCGRKDIEGPVRRALSEVFAGTPGCQNILANARYEVYE